MGAFTNPEPLSANVFASTMESFRTAEQPRAAMAELHVPRESGVLRDIHPVALTPEYRADETSWSLLRRFAQFWPKGQPAPPQLPWLGDLVTRRKAWRWVSQFPRLMADVDPEDLESIKAFIAQTLTDVEPDPLDVQQAQEENGDKKCCKKNGGDEPPEPLPPGDDLFYIGCPVDECGARPAGSEDDPWPVCAKQCVDKPDKTVDCGPCEWR